MMTKKAALMMTAMTMRVDSTKVTIEVDDDNDEKAWVLMTRMNRREEETLPTVNYISILLFLILFYYRYYYCRFLTFDN